MSDLISRQAALDAMATWDWQELYLPIHFKQLLEELPSAERRGHWIYVELETPTRWSYRCSNCSRLSGDPSEYCPNCGAIMDGG